MRKKYSPSSITYVNLRKFDGRALRSDEVASPLGYPQP